MPDESLDGRRSGRSNASLSAFLGALFVSMFMFALALWLTREWMLGKAGPAVIAIWICFVAFSVFAGLALNDVWAN